MDGRHFDSLTRALTELESRRRLLAVLATLPMLGSLFGLLNLEDAEAKDRRRRRKARHRRRHNPGKHKGKGKRKHKRPCVPDSTAQTCAGRCGQAINNCQQSVDCGPCACDPACGACLVCDTTSRACVVDASRVGQACGSTGQICGSNGACACTNSTCPACGNCENGQCRNTCTDQRAPDCVNDQCVCTGAGNAVCSLSRPACCPDGCQDLENGPQNCGSCGNVCDAGQVCRDGVCNVICGSDFCPASTEACCSGVCQSLSTLEAECPVGTAGFLTYPDGAMRCAAGSTPACACLGVYRDCAPGTQCTMLNGGVICDQA